MPANDYNDSETKVIVRYVIGIKEDPATGKKEFDPATSTATFENEFKEDDGKPFVTERIPIVSIKGNPATGEIESFTVKSEKSWDRKRPALSNGLSGEIDVKKRKATIKYRQSAEPRLR